MVYTTPPGSGLKNEIIGVVVVVTVNGRRSKYKCTNNKNGKSRKLEKKFEDN